MLLSRCLRRSLAYRLTQFLVTQVGPFRTVQHPGYSLHRVFGSLNDQAVILNGYTNALARLEAQFAEHRRRDRHLVALADARDVDSSAGSHMSMIRTGSKVFNEPVFSSEPDNSTVQA